MSAAAGFVARLLSALQYPLPQHALTAVARAVSENRTVWLKNWLIKSFCQLFKPALNEAVSPDPEDYSCFNAFFTRELKPEARPLAAAPVSSPCDGRISQIGIIEDTSLLQAKGQQYSLAALLGSGDGDSALRDGLFATIYLSPRDYHRIHMPASGRLLRMRHIPGRLFSVSPGTVACVPEVFARNERIACWFQGESGPFLLIMVGALLVGSMTTVWQGTVNPPRARQINEYDYAGQNLHYARGAEIGRFNYGSTVILLFPGGQFAWDELAPGDAVKMGQALAATHSA